MAGNCFLTIIIPIFNCCDKLPENMERLLRVEAKDIEILLIDDGSTDGSTELCRYYAAYYPIVHVCHQPNSGPAAARNRGMQLARGKYVTFADADDYIDPEAFGKSLELLRRIEADIWATDFCRVADNGCVLDRVYQIAPKAEPIIGRGYLSSFLAAKDCVWNIWRYIFSRAFIETNNLRFSEGYSIAEDLEFVVRALRLCERPAFFHEPYYSYRVNYGESLTRRYTAEHVRQLIRMLRSAALYLNTDEPSRLIRAKLAREYILNLSLMYEVPKTERAAALKELEAARLLMDGASGAYAAAAAGIKLLGIPASAALLLAMKRVKRLKRKIKTRRFDSEQ